MVGSCGKTENRNRYRDILRNRYRLLKNRPKNENRYRLKKPISTQLYCKYVIQTTVHCPTLVLPRCKWLTAVRTRKLILVLFSGAIVVGKLRFLTKDKTASMIYLLSAMWLMLVSSATGSVAFRAKVDHHTTGTLFFIHRNLQ